MFVKIYSPSVAIRCENWKSRPVLVQIVRIAQLIRKHDAWNDFSDAADTHSIFFENFAKTIKSECCWLFTSLLRTSGVQHIILLDWRALSNKNDCNSALPNINNCNITHDIAINYILHSYIRYLSWYLIFSLTMKYLALL